MDTTVYSLTYPETQEVIEQLWDKKPHEIYKDPWTKKQDNTHHPLLENWKKWAQKVIKIPAEMKHQYYTNGSSEAIRESLSHYATSGGKKIHVFEGEYEGYKAYAQPLGLTVIEHKRDSWEKLQGIERDDLFYISQPSSIDGNIWPNYNEFAKKMQESNPQAKIMLDVCYVGTTTSNQYHIEITDNVQTVFFSLSKVFGVYYHRIGGCFSRKPIQNLYGNKWFKNLFSIKLGEELLRRFALGELPKKYQERQESISQQLNITASDVVILLSNSTNSPTKFSRRQTTHGHTNRYCITREISEAIA